MFAAQIALIGTAGVGGKSGSFFSGCFLEKEVCARKATNVENVCTNRATQWRTDE